MKKILALLIALICLSSCFQSSPPSYTNEGVTTETTANDRFVATKFEFNGHKYIQFRDKHWSSSYDKAAGYVHDPDCPCLKNTEK